MRDDLCDETGLPGRQLDLVDAPQHLCHRLQPGILMRHHAHAGMLDLGRQPAIDWNEQNDHRQASQEGIPDL